MQMFYVEMFFSSLLCIIVYFSRLWIKLLMKVFRLGGNMNLLLDRSPGEADCAPSFLL